MDQKEQEKARGRVSRKMIVIILIMLLIASGTGVASAFLIIRSGEIKKEQEQTLEEKENNHLAIEEDAEKWDGELPTVGEVSEAVSEFTEIPGYAKIVLNKENPELSLINPDTNTVYFVYTLKKDGETIYQTNAIEPDKYVSANLYDILGVGTHSIEMTIECYDITTQATCNGAVQVVDVTIK